LIGFNGNIEWDITKPNGQPRRKVSNKRAKEKFGFTPRIKLKEGLSETIEWYKTEFLD
jgi:GDP-L-fucose synthase